jgi:hypothetical protein
MTECSEADRKIGQFTRIARQYVVTGIEAKTLWDGFKNIPVYRISFDSAGDSEVKNMDTAYIHLPMEGNRQPLVGDKFSGMFVSEKWEL